MKFQDSAMFRTLEEWRSGLIETNRCSYEITVTPSNHVLVRISKTSIPDGTVHNITGNFEIIPEWQGDWPNAKIKEMLSEMNLTK